jgi:hypothetical protein
VTEAEGILEYGPPSNLIFFWEKIGAATFSQLALSSTVWYQRPHSKFWRLEI